MPFSQYRNINDVAEIDEEELDNDYGGECYYCGTYLDAQYDYFCIDCERQTRDNCSEACSDCDIITCSRCISIHYSETHPDSEEV